MKQHSETMNTFLRDAHGEIRYNMTNDCMFRAVLQENNKALRGLVCSLLHLAESEVISAVITNPIVLGEKTADKEFRLDINVVLNNEVLINLEMQVANRLNWRNRSVMYLCRSFDQLNHGQDYTEAKPAVHIGFLDYTLFPDRPEFYASYKLINVKNHYTYNDSLTLHVLDLTRIDLATEEDKRYHIHEWAAFFKAATWEEVKMIAAKNEPIQEAAETMFRWSAEDQMRKWCRDREEYYLDQRANERLLAERERAIAENKEKIKQDARVIAEKDEKIEQLLAEIEALKAQK
ncbi:MAG: Rpn family recombination-promoting nuclease/putative transposase [Bacteroidales bacterium]|nr:Rpn family recombination-promoting nuclease/putative transposase [Bacteroidales bacterium]MCM1415505.1 Rpn family recombination-promoting nuclease/putative transposase [bacterium]